MSLTWVKARNRVSGHAGDMTEQPLLNADAETVVSLEGETQFAPNGIVSRTVMRSGPLRVVLFGFAEGQELTEHATPQHALIHILSGECEFTLAGRVRALKAGDFLYMPPEMPHALRATKRFSMLLTLCRNET